VKNFHIWITEKARFTKRSCEFTSRYGSGGNWDDTLILISFKSDRINNVSSKGDRCYYESSFLGDRINNLSAKGDRQFCEL
jgi:hypothetical protein